MMRWPLLSTASVALMLLPGCSRVAERGTAVEHHPAGDGPVVFDLEPLPSGDGSRQWIGIYRSSGKVARFRIDFGAPETAPGNAGVKTGEGTLLPEPGSDSSNLLVALEKALQAKTAPRVPVTKTSVPFTYVILGTNATPSGNWTGHKLIFGDGDRESEIFLNLDASTKKGQFSMKDPRFGDLALAELAKVL